MSNLTKPFSGRWISVLARPFGTDKVWEYVERNNSTEAVCIIATTEEPEPQIVLIKQFRYPLDAHIIEFPAGLCDKDEAPEITAVRELQEETGYMGVVTETSKPVYTSPGLTNERLSFVRIKVTGKGQSNLDPDEQIEAFLVPLKSLKSKLVEFQEAGHHVDAKLWFFASGQTH